MNEPLPWQGTVNFPRPVPPCSTNLLLPYFEAAAKEMRDHHARLQAQDPKEADPTGCNNSGHDHRSPPGRRSFSPHWWTLQQNHCFSAPNTSNVAFSPASRTKESWSHHQLVFQCLAHGIDEGRRQPPTAGRGRHSPTCQSEGFAGHRVRRHDTSPPPIAVGAGDRQWLGSHRPRHRTATKDDAV